MKNKQMERVSELFSAHLRRMGYDYGSVTLSLAALSELSIKVQLHQVALLEEILAKLPSSTYVKNVVTKP